jgi:hypothetical protein
MTSETPLPDQLEGHWDTAEGRQIAEGYRAKSRGELCHGEMSDLMLANAIYMASRNDLELIAFQEAAKQRIRWLSVQLALATRPPAPDKQLTDVVEKCRDRFAEYVELHRAKLTDDAVLNVREAIWRKVEHNQEMVRMCDEALASLNTAPAGDDVRLPEHATEPMVEAGLIELGKWLGVRPDEIDDLVVGSVWIVMWRAALKATTHTPKETSMTPPKDKLLTDVVERVARAMRFSTRPDGVEYEDTDETWDKLSHRAKSYWRDFARAAVEAAFVERQP